MKKGIHKPYLCRKCGETNSAEFYGIQRGECKSCTRARTSRYQTGNSTFNRKRHLRRAYGITPERYDEMLAAQHGLCALCGKPPDGEKLMVDHNHETDEVRGLIHRFCNSLLGFAREDETILFAAIKYIRRFKPTQN